MSFRDLITEAGRQRKIVRLKLKAKNDGAPSRLIDFEPYSSREFAGKVSFFCLDVENCTCLNVDLESVLEAEVTERRFKPRFPIAL